MNDGLYNLRAGLLGGTSVRRGARIADDNRRALRVDDGVAESPHLVSLAIGEVGRVGDAQSPVSQFERGLVVSDEGRKIRFFHMVFSSVRTVKIEACADGIAESASRRSFRARAR